MKKQKPLLPSLKEKKRYLIYEVLGATSFPEADVHKAITGSIKELIGLFGMAKAGVLFLPAEKTNRGIIRVTTKYADAVKAAFCTLRNINKSPVIVRSVGLSGTLHKARLKFL